MLNLVGGRALAAASGCLAIAGCTALAGIQDGTLVTASDSGSGGDVIATDSTGADGPQGDGAVADGGGDRTVDGNGMDSTPPVDTGGEDGPGGFNSVCFMVNNSTVLLDDLSTADPVMFGTNFGHVLWVVPANIGDGVYVVSQGQNENADFTLYQVDFSQQNSMKMAVPNLGSAGGNGGVRLLDVEPTPSGPMAMASYSNAAMQQGLQVVPLPSTWGGAIGTATSIAAPPLFGTNVYLQSGTLAATATQSYWLASTSSGSNRALLAGAANTAMSDSLLTTSTQFNATGIPYFDLSGQVYAFVQGLGDGGNSSDTVLAVPDNFTSAGVQAPVTSSASLFAIIGAHVSAADATKAALLGVSLDSSGNGQMWAARLPPSSLTTLNLGAPQFTAGDLLSINDLSFNGGSNFWYADQFFAVGQGMGASGPDQIILDWFDSNGHAVARPSTSGPLYTGTNTVDLAAGGVNMVIGGIAGLFIAWIEDVFPEAGVHYQKLFAAKVSCSLATGGG